ncbi:ABC transporter substrate-binding protein [Terrilactibacillus laevilacticus]|uniref:ABC transporter substrate-binding protein n=1 Tax=Terrilactibacillus laevilacticus TaxID=1380157 RepID=UPI001147471B|nr:ABC transporter substrate-binding protein [Terrilactibacillus laevilacticus]
MKKYVVLLLSLVMIFSLALAGCSSNKKSSSGGNSGNTLIYGRGADTTSLDPAVVTDGESFKVTKNIFDTLVDYKGQTTDIEPSLAESWDISKDGLTYTFHLKKGIKFQDGTNFNADAVVYNFNRWMNGKASGKFAYYPSMFGGFKGDKGHIINSVTATDSSTVVFKLKNPSAPFLKDLAMTPFAISSPAAIKKYGKDYGTKAAVGTGPFKFKSWEKNNTITLVKNSKYFKKGEPKLDSIIFKVIPDNSSRLNALKNGEIDLMDGVNPSDLEGLKGNSSLKVFYRPPMNVAYYGFNVTKKPFNNPKVRQALSYAVDKQSLIDAFYNGDAVKAKNPIPSNFLGYNDSIQDYNFDLKKAKQLLKEAGYPNGFSSELWTMTNPRDYMPSPEKTAEALQANFKKIGVNLKIVTVEWSSYLDKLTKGQAPSYLMGWIGDNGDPDNFLYTLLDKDAIGSNNFSYYDNEKLHKVLLQAQAETDENKRADLYKQAQVIIHNDAPWVPLVHAKAALVGSSKIKGFAPNPTGSDKFNTVSIGK